MMRGLHPGMSYLWQHQGNLTPSSSERKPIAARDAILYPLRREISSFHSI